MDVLHNKPRGSNVDNEINDTLMRTLIPFAEALAVYHQHKIVGLRNLPKQGPALIVSNHSLATYDIVLLMYEIFKETGRIARPLIDRLFFKIPGLGRIMDLTGSVQGGREEARALLERGDIVCVAPGGMREALRPSTERYQIIWDRRSGFIRVALETQTPIILAACPRADDLYEVLENPITKWAYKNFKIPIFLARGLGPTPLPRPIKLTHHLSKAIKPPKLAQTEEEIQQQVAELHKRVIQEMEQMIGKAIARPKSNPKK